MLRHKCDWVNCDASVAGHLPLGWGRLVVEDPILEDDGDNYEETEYLLCPQHLVELRKHLRTEPTITHDPPPEGVTITLIQGERPPAPCIWKGCQQKSSRRHGGSIMILADENRLLRDIVGVSFQGESDLCATHMAALAGFLGMD
jgi:hypothetical protein